ncbi:MAG TPA: head-tail connector protein [Aestuariivirga sp.]|nr:head-tail connector protein [Aestuariivirga sp.]
MWYQAKVVVPPEAKPISVSDVKAQCRIDHDSEDGYLASLIDAAVSHIETLCMARFAPTTVDIMCDGFSDLLNIPEGPLSSIVSIKYVDISGSEQTVDSSGYVSVISGLDSSVRPVTGARWPEIQDGSRITVRAIVGFENCPPDVAHAMKLIVAHWNENREPVSIGNATTDLPMMVDHLICNYRRYP